MSDIQMTRITHTHDEMEPFVYDGNIYRKKLDGTFEWWVVSYAEKYKVIDEALARYMKELEEYEKELASLPWWKRWFNPPEKPRSFISSALFNDEHFKTWQPVSCGPYYKPDLLEDR